MVKTAGSLIGLAGSLILIGAALGVLKKIDKSTKLNKKKFKVPNVKLTRI